MSVAGEDTAPAGLPIEDRDGLLDAEADAGHRWAASAAAGRNVLIAGCGSGHGAPILLEAGARSVVGIDPDPRRVEAATRMYGERAQFVAGELLALPVATGGFDMVVCLDGLRETPDPGSAIGELARVLADDGLLFAGLPRPAAPADELPGVARRPDGEAALEALSDAFGEVRRFRRRAAVATTIAPEEGAAAAPIDDARWLGGDSAEDRTLLVAAAKGELPALGSVASLVGMRDLLAQREAVDAWEQRAREAEAAGSAKHWELVAAREAQRRLRVRLHQLEHRPLRMISRVLRRKPAKLGPGPPIRVSELKPEKWD